MEAYRQTISGQPRPATWFRGFLKEELRPYPGRAKTVMRMVIAATLVMTICMTFRLRYAFMGVFYALFVFRESPRPALELAGTIILPFLTGAAYVLFSAWFVLNNPLLHFLWVIGSFFIVFFALSATTDYWAVVPFAVVIALVVPVWDRHVSAESNVEDTLRVLLAVSIGAIVGAVVELTLSSLRPGDNIILPLAEWLAAVQSVLACYLKRRPVDQETENKIASLAVLGTSTLRRTLWLSNYSPEYNAQMGAVVALVGRLVDIVASSTQLKFSPTERDQKELIRLDAAIAKIRGDLVNRRIPGPIQFDREEPPSTEIPLLRAMQGTVALIPDAFANSRSMHEYPSSSEQTPEVKLMVPDAFNNLDHASFALKGCIAASLCYIIYNSIDWVGISTAVTTCLVTALSTIGSSRQKQIVRFAGAAVGGFIFGMGSQIFILPYVDSIVGFTVLFVFVTSLASWVMTSSPRLSYFGLQIAVAFYFVHLQEFAMQRSLAVARDRVVGIMLGLFMMWLVFDQLWGSPAAVEMKREFISNLRSLAQLAREPHQRDIKLEIDHSYSLREEINAHFDNVRSLADAVLFEFGSSRQKDLALRDRIRRWQPQLRALFLMQVASLKYRLRFPGFELPEPVRQSQQEFEGELATMLDGMADRIDGKARKERKASLERPYQLLEQTMRTRYPGSEKSLTEQQVTLLSLSRSMTEVAAFLENEI
jgi:multidrug resistance protein MdtO